MKKRILKSIPIILILLIDTIIFSFAATKGILEEEDLLRKKIKQNPVMEPNGLRFYYFADKEVQTLYMKSNFDKWKYRYPFVQIGDSNNYELFLPIKNTDFQFKKGKYKYIFLLNGLFKPDPMSQDKTENEFGEEISIFKIEKDLHDFMKTPVKIKDKKNIYRFYYKNNKAGKIFLVGSFNNWDPYDIKMKKIENNLYMVEIYLLPGKTYYYNFVVDNEWEKDPFNENVTIDRLERILSILKT